MTKLFYYSLTVIISLLIIASCTPRSPFIESDVVYQLNVTVDPAEAGSVTHASREIIEGKKVELSVSPNKGWVFDSWQGDHTGNENPATIIMDSDKDILAQFIKKEYALTIDIEGEGTVAEEIIQEKTTDYPFGTMVQLTAKPALGWSFSRWEEDLMGSENPAQIEVTEAKEVKAIFVRKTYQISVSVDGEGSVSKTLVSGIKKEEGVYEFNSVVEMSATPADGWLFSHWEGDMEENTNPVSIEIDSDKSVIAVFEQRSNDLTIHIKGEGSVTKEVILKGKFMKLTATVASGWIFDRWEGDLSGSKNPVLIGMNLTKTVTAVFVKESFTLSVETKRRGSVSVALQSGSESDGQYESGSEVELTATTDKDWEFIHWEGDLSGDRNPHTITIDTDKSVRAVFKKK